MALLDKSADPVDNLTEDLGSSPARHTLGLYQFRKTL